MFSRRSVSEIDFAVTRLAQKCAVEIGETVLLDLGGELLSQLLLGLRPELQGEQFARPLPHAVGDIVARNHQILTEFVLTAQHDMGVRMFGVEMVDCDPFQFGPEILLHAGDQIANKGPNVFKLSRVLRRDDEAELVPVALAPFQKCLPVGLIARGVVEPARLVLLRDPVTLDVAQMGSGRLNAAALELDNPRLDDDAARRGPKATTGPAPAHGAAATSDPVA